MSDVIRLLPDSVANQIAAGEVIQRPASVIKELVENAVDAGATDIQIIIKDAGRTLIQVIDNGKGMTETDARMAFERHATSKINKAADLFTLTTMGFRGEALPSICAISQVELKTKTEDSAMGTRLLINATKVETQEPIVCETGSNFMIKNLFFNVPARRKFLKSDSVELSNIMREFERLALVNNNIGMSIDTGFRKFELRPATFVKRIGDIWKNNLDLHLIPVEIETSLIRISGYISRPEYARRRNALQYLIVNGRNMRHPYFHKAILSCYDQLIAADTQPCYFLKFEVEPSTIDVNIHPTKNEIKFEHEQEIWPILQASVKAAIGRAGGSPSIDFNSDPVPVKPLNKGENPVAPTMSLTSGYNPFKDTFDRPVTTPQFKKREERTPKNWDTLYAEFMSGAHGFNGEHAKKDVPSAHSKGVITGLEMEANPVSTVCIQYNESYIVTTSKEGLMIIDQHRAHLKILFEDYLHKMKSNEHVSQKLMFSETVKLDPAHLEALAAVKDILADLGFEISYEEEKIKIISVPAFIKNLDAADIIVRIIESVSELDENYGKEEAHKDILLEKVALLLARSSAIRRGTKLSQIEMENIITGLFCLKDPYFTPNGNRAVYIIDGRSVQNMF